MDAFDAAVAFILTAEGATSNDPEDPGGLTIFGISSKAHPDIDVSHLTERAAVDLYRSRYWERYRLERLPPPLGVATLDAVVQHGRTGVRILQDAVAVTVDGVIGPITLGACYRMSREYAVSRFCAKRGVYYAHLPQFTIYSTGWLRRLILLYHYAITYADHAD